MSLSLEAETTSPPVRRNGSRATPPFAALRAFDAVGRLGGLRRAALDLGVDHAAISRHLRSLEVWLGVQLIDRLQTGGRLTEEGRAYHSRISAAFSEMAAATEAVMLGKPDARVKIWCIPGIASHWLAGRLGDFQTANPDLNIELKPVDRPPNFAAREADADLRYRYLDVGPPESAAPGVRSLELSRPLVFPVASPAFIAEHGPFNSLDDLLRAPLLHKKDDDHWRRWVMAQGREDVGPLAGLRLWYNHVTVQAARNGTGVALANEFLLGDDLKTGQLKRVEVGEPIALGAYYFVTRADQWTSAPILRLRRWLFQSAQGVYSAH